MPKLWLHVSDDVAVDLRTRAWERGTSVSALLAEIVTRDSRRARPGDWLDRAISSAFDRVADRFDACRERRRCGEWRRFALRTGGEAAVAQWVWRHPSAAPACDQP